MGDAQADLVQAGLLKNPVFEVGVRFPDRAPAGTYLNFGAAEDFLDIALLPARKKLAAAEFDEAKARVTNAVLSLAAETSEDFYGFQADQQMVELRKTATQAAAASLVAATKLHDAGNLNELDLVNARALDVRARIDLGDAEGALAECARR